MARRVVLVCVLLMSLSGCLVLTGCLAEITIDTVHPVTKLPLKATYTRWGNQEIGSFSWKDGTLKFESQKSDNTAMYETFNKLIDRIP